MPPPRKKARSSRAPSNGDIQVEPIVFKSPGLTADVQLLVFDQVFHVHSVILKLHSNYFRRFLDSPEKSKQASGGLFRYNYISAVDEDGSWGLEPVDAVEANLPGRSDIINVDEHLLSFKHLLSAMYNRPYSIKAYEDLRLLVQLADFYCALPIVSATLTHALISGPFLEDGQTQTELSLYSFEVLLLAKKLRHKRLFKECFVLSVGKYNRDETPDILADEPDLMMLIMHEYIEISDRINFVHGLVVALLARRKLQTDDVIKLLEDNEGAPMRQRSYLKQLQALVTREESEDVTINHVVEELEILLTNRLALERHTDADDLQFLVCADLSDTALPWNEGEVDW